MQTCCSRHDLCSYYCGAALQIISPNSHNPICSVAAHWCQVRNGLLDYTSNIKTCEIKDPIRGEMLFVWNQTKRDTERFSISTLLRKCPERRLSLWMFCLFSCRHKTTAGSELDLMDHLRIKAAKLIFLTFLNHSHKASSLEVFCSKVLCLKQHYVTLTVTCGFEKQHLTMHYNTAQNSNSSKTGSYFMERMSSGFPSDVPQLLCLNSVIHGGSWKQHVGCLQTEAAAAAAGGCWGQLG